MKVIVIGGVAAGMSAASKIIRTNKEAIINVYEKTGFFSYGACGLPYYIGGYNDDYRKLIARTEKQFNQMGINTFNKHEVIDVYPKEKKVTVKNLNTNEVFFDYYDKLLVSTGASPINLGIDGEELIGVHNLNTLEDAIFLKEYAKKDEIKSIAIVGGGYIGIECADIFLGLNKEVKVIEYGDRILQNFEENTSDLALKKLQDNNVDVKLKEEVLGYSGDHKVRKIHTSKGTYDVDLVIVSVGVRPNTGFINCDSLDKMKNGAIIVNKKMESSVKDIYAAGDCASTYNMITGETVFIPLGTVANKSGRVAGTNMAGGREEFIGSLGTSAIKIHDLEIVKTGLSIKDCIRNNIDYNIITVETTDRPAYYTKPEKLIINLIYENNTKRILGAEVMGKNDAVMRGNVFAVAIQGKMTTSELGMSDLAYAPPFSNVWDAINVACNAVK